MIDEKKLIEELESLPLIHGRYDIAHANGDFISGIETWHEAVLKTINKQPKVVPKLLFPTTSEIAKEVAEKAMDEYEYKGKTIRQWIDEIQKHEWIECKYRMPEDHTLVLVWFEYFRYGDYNIPYQTYGLSCTVNGEWSGFVNDQSGWKDLKILAWAPLPGIFIEGD